MEVRHVGAVPGMGPDMGDAPFRHGDEVVEVACEDLRPGVLPNG